MTRLNDDNEKMTNMEKKKYIAPNCEVVELGIVSMIAGSVTETPGNKDENFELESNRHRGQWGNLWD